MFFFKTSTFARSILFTRSSFKKFQAVHLGHFNDGLKKNQINLKSSTNSSLISSYIELTRLKSPTGTLLLFLPCAWSISIASPSIIASLPLCCLFLAGSVVMRGAGIYVYNYVGCIINDWWDKDFDGKVERTKNRVLAKEGRIVSDRMVGSWLVGHLSVGAMILFSLNKTRFSEV